MRSAPWPNGFPCIWGGGFEPDFIGPPQALMGGSAWKEGLLGFFSWEAAGKVVPFSLGSPQLITVLTHLWTFVCVFMGVCAFLTDLSSRIQMIARILRREAVLNKPITLYVLQTVTVTRVFPQIKLNSSTQRWAVWPKTYRLAYNSESSAEGHSPISTLLCWLAITATLITALKHTAASDSTSLPLRAPVNLEPAPREPRRDWCCAYWERNRRGEQN